MEHLLTLTACSSTPAARNSADSSVTTCLNRIDGSQLPLYVNPEDARRVLHKTRNSLVWIDIDGDPAWNLALIGGDPRLVQVGRLELHEVAFDEEVCAYSRVEFAAGSDPALRTQLWDVVDPWIRITGPSSHVSTPLAASGEVRAAYREILARDVCLPPNTRLSCDPEQVLFRASESMESQESRAQRLSVAVEGASPSLNSSAYVAAARRILQRRLELTRPCRCPSPFARICLSREIELGRLRVVEVAACCLPALAECHAVLEGIGAGIGGYAADAMCDPACV